MVRHLQLSSLIPIDRRFAWKLELLLWIATEQPWSVGLESEASCEQTELSPFFLAWLYGMTRRYLEDCRRDEWARTLLQDATSLTSSKRKELSESLFGAKIDTRATEYFDRRFEDSVNSTGVLIRDSSK